MLGGTISKIIRFDAHYRLHIHVTVANPLSYGLRSLTFYLILPLSVCLIFRES